MKGYLRYTLLAIVIGLKSIHVTQGQIATPDSLQLGAVVSHYRVEGSDVSVLADITATSLVSTRLIEDAGIATWKGSYDHIPVGLSYVTINGYLKISKTNTYVFKLQNTDGAELYIDKKKIISNDSVHSFSDRDGEVYLTEGFHPFLLRAFNSPKAKNREVSLAMATPDGSFEWVPSSMVYSSKKVSSKLQKITAIQVIKDESDDSTVATKLHPSYKLYDLDADKDIQLRIGGIDFLPNGKMVISTWNKDGGIYLIDGVVGDSPKPVFKRIAWGLAEPLGVKVVDGKIFVLQKQELTQLIDVDGDEVIDEYKTICNAWGATGNFHEFAFGLVYKDGFFYATLATAIQPGGKSTLNQNKDRGKCVKIGMDGSYEIMASGLRTPNGIGLGVDGEIFVADNQGDWIPSCKIVHIKKGAFYGSYSVDLYNIGKYTETPPLVWLPQGEIGLSASQPTVLNDGPYKGQMIHGDVTHGGLKRVFVEKIKGEYQGVVFPFSQGFAAGINRVCWGPDGALYVGGIGSTGNWSQYNKKWYGLQKIKYTNKTTFEILAVRAKANGFELEFTEPVDLKSGNDVAAYDIQQWQYIPTMEYGGPKVDLEALKIESINFSTDRKKVFLEIPGLKEGFVQAISIPGAFQSVIKQSLWANTGWYTLNNIPAEKGVVNAAKTKPVATAQKSKTPVSAPKQPTDPYRKMEASEEKAVILAGGKLIKPSGCNTCHAQDQKILGPSFNMVAQKYANDPATLKKLTEKIYKGGGGVWGEYAMAAQSHLKKDDITKMVRYILSLK